MSNESGTYVGAAIVCKNAPSDLCDILYDMFGDDVVVHAIGGIQYVISNCGSGKIHSALSCEEKATEIESIYYLATDFIESHRDVFYYIRNEHKIDSYITLVALNWHEH